ncbi:MAG: hypothetical protein LBP77_04725 [Rickettsiales bacterium]|nr:hypothetical protein [Rickettsiales bacterium]
MACLLLLSICLPYNGNWYNIPKYRIFLPLSNFFNDVIRLSLLRTPKPSIQSNNIPFGVIPALGAGIQKKKRKMDPSVSYLDDK